ncbi:MAG: hypothetical protein PHX78_11940 [bacterium]|nr:hypothetical protein [bacterium]
MKVYLIYLFLVCAMFTVNSGVYAQENKGRDPFRLPMEIETALEKNNAPAAVKSKEEIKENLDDRANAIAAEEQAKQQEKEAREDQERQEEQKRQEEMALAQKADEEEISKITLSGIVFSEGRRTAILDRKILREGDALGVRKIIGIEKNKVILLSNGRKYTIELKGENR